ncbi:MAG: hypothetical protein H0T48_01980 [Gemmatimonadaceae bacterium]|nr:hypothetical protein [Gemmatimonadaceae bacterium]
MTISRLTLFRAARFAVLLALPAGVGAQSLLDRPPSLSGGWTGAPGTLHFNLLHRFSTSDGPENKVSNVPTFLLAAGLPKRILAGLNYSTNSSLAPRYPNEWEVFARWTPVAEGLRRAAGPRRADRLQQRRCRPPARWCATGRRLKHGAAPDTVAAAKH